LNAAILSKSSVQGDECASKALAAQLAQLSLGRIKRMRVDTSRSADAPPISTATRP
jgi:hypothetical protein